MTKIRTTLFRFGFGYVWQNKGVQEVNLFIRCFRQRLTDNRWQDWKSRTDASDRFNFYRQFKTNHVQATYLSVDVNKYIRNSLIKFRFGVSPIVVHSLRYKTHAYTDTIFTAREVHLDLFCYYQLKTRSLLRTLPYFYT